MHPDKHYLIVRKDIQKKNEGNTKIYFDFMLEWTMCLMNINVYVNINEKKKFNSIGSHSNRSQILTRKIDQGLNNDIGNNLYRVYVYVYVCVCAWDIFSWPSSISITEKWHKHTRWVIAKREEKNLLLYSLT